MARLWLLDVNVPKAVAGLLAEVGVEAHHATARGWGDLKNGVLVETASLRAWDDNPITLTPGCVSHWPE